MTSGATCIMFASTLLLFFIAVVECRGKNEKCDVYPKDPVVSMGDDVQVMFKAPDNSLCSNIPSYSPEKLFWMLNDKKIHESLYTLLNSTIPAVVIQNFTLQSGMVTCHINVGGKDIVLGGTNVKVYFPPVKPTNISCITVVYKSFTCYWDSGKETVLDTTYNVTRKTNYRITNCTSKSSHCSFKDKDILFPTEIWVTAQNSQGAARSDVLKIEDIFSTVKIDPPQKVEAEPLFDTSELKVIWKPVANDFDGYAPVYEVQYSYQQGGSHRTHMGRSTRPELRITAGSPCTRYTISVRCALEGNWSPVWSDWSAVTTVISPLKVHSINLLLWRKIHWPDERRNRTVQLMWKGVPTSCDAIDSYQVTLKAKSNPPQVMQFKPADTKASITVDKEAYTVRIVAYRRENVLSENTTTIPAAREVSGFLPVEAAQVFSHNGQINISWSAPSQSHATYMVDWSADNDDYSWQETNTTHISFRGVPLKLYTITVTPLYLQRPGQETTLQAYAKEGAPGAVSWVNASEVETRGARIRWARMPRDVCCGFVVNYTVFYRMPSGPEQSVTVNSTLQEVRLSQLQSGTSYTVHVMASSVAGRTNSSVNTGFTTLSYDPNFITMLGLFGGLGIILFLLIGLCCFIIQKKRILKSVPNPGDSEAVSWPSSYGQRPLLMPFNESYSEKLRISICDYGPAPTENTQPVSPVRQPDPANDVSPSAMKCTEEPIRSPPYVSEYSTPAAWDGGKTSPQGQTSGDSGPDSPYLKNCIPSMNGSVHPYSEAKPASSSEWDSRALRDPQPHRFAPPTQAYVSVDMLQEGMFSPI